MEHFRATDVAMMASGILGLATYLVWGDAVIAVFISVILYPWIHAEATVQKGGGNG